MYCALALTGLWIRRNLRFHRKGIFGLSEKRRHSERSEEFRRSVLRRWSQHSLDSCSSIAGHPYDLLETNHIYLQIIS